MTQSTQAPARTRAQIVDRTLRNDKWWQNPLVTGGALTVILCYLLYATFVNADYWWRPYLSPMYSPCLPANCVGHSGFNLIVWWAPLTPAILVLAGPASFRTTCYYYRKAYYRAFLGSPPACAVREPHKRYRGESRVPLILQNIHRYTWWLALGFVGVLIYDAVIGFQNHQGQWGHMGFGTVMLILDALFLGLYTVSCHACRHIVGGRLKHFSRHPVRYWMWTQISKLNARHMELAWISLIFVALTDAYIRLVAAGIIVDPRFF